MISSVWMHFFFLIHKSNQAIDVTEKRDRETYCPSLIPNHNRNGKTKLPEQVSSFLSHELKVPQRIFSQIFSSPSTMLQFTSVPFCQTMVPLQRSFPPLIRTTWWSGQINNEKTKSIIILWLLIRISRLIYKLHMNTDVFDFRSPFSHIHKQRIIVLMCETAESVFIKMIWLNECYDFRFGVGYY